MEITEIYKMLVILSNYHCVLKILSGKIWQQ